MIKNLILLFLISLIGIKCTSNNSNKAKKEDILLIIDTIQQKETTVSDVNITTIRNSLKNRNKIRYIASDKKIIDYLFDHYEGGDKECKLTFKKGSNYYEYSYDCTHNDNHTVKYFIEDNKIDFDNNGIGDYLVYRDSEGMLGGNANTNAQYIFLLINEKGLVKKEFKILCYAPFSYNYLELKSYSKGKLVTKVNQNHRTLYTSGDQGDNYYDRELIKTFYFVDDMLYEKTYLEDCQMAKMKDKTIFKKEIENVHRETAIDMHNYTETQEEKLQTETKIITASMQGCDNLELSFNINVTYDSLNFDPFYILLKEIDYLTEITRYKSVLKQIKKEIKSNQLSKRYKHTNNKQETKLELEGSNFYLFLSNYTEKSKYSLILNYLKVNNSLQKHNWDITSRLNPNNSKVYEDEY